MGGRISDGRYNVEPRWWRGSSWTLSSTRLQSTFIVGIRRGGTGSRTGATADVGTMTLGVWW